MSQSMLSRRVLEPLLDMRHDVERAFAHFFRHPALHAQVSDTEVAAAPLIESWVDEGDKQFHLTMPLPGLKPEEITLHLQGKTLVLSAEHEEADYFKKIFFEREISIPSLRHTVALPGRTIALPDGVDADKLCATLSDGVLEITAPIAASSLPERIPIRAESKMETIAKAESKAGKAAAQ